MLLNDLLLCLALFSLAAKYLLLLLFNMITLLVRCSGLTIGSDVSGMVPKIHSFILLNILFRVINIIFIYFFIGYSCCYFTRVTSKFTCRAPIVT